MDRLYQQALKIMSIAFEELSKKANEPQLLKMGDGYVYRYKEETIHQAIILKLARVVTGLQAISFLNKAGLIQEQAVLQRIINEFEEDIVFLCFGVIFDEITDLHKEYLSAFYEEEFDDPNNATHSTQKRPMIPRKKIRAFVSKDRGAGYDQSSTIEIGRTIHKAYSGYVHGAAPHIMELYFGKPPKFQLFNGINSPLYKDHIDDLLSYYYRAILSFAYASKAFGDENLFLVISDYSRKFAIDSGREDQLLAPQ